VFVVVVSGAFCSRAVLTYGADDITKQIQPQYTARGELIAPAGYETWVFIGSNLGLVCPSDLLGMTKGEAERGPHEFHNIYIDPAAYQHFVAPGQFPNPAILVMEKFAAAEREPRGIVTRGTFSGKRIGIEVVVKNDKRPDGSTTLWAYHDFVDTTDAEKSKASAPAFPDRVCESCYLPRSSKASTLS
jgi:hypothetical protein